VPGHLVFRGGPSKVKPSEMSWEHIGPPPADGMVLQAGTPVTGVHADERYNAANWTVRGRLNDAYLTRTTLPLFLSAGHADTSLDISFSRLIILQKCLATT